MKRKIEILLFWLIPVIVLEEILRAYIFYLFGDLLSGKFNNLDRLDILPGETLGTKLTYAKSIKVLSGIFTNLILAGWLYWVIVATNTKKLLWAVAGLVLNYWSLLLFFGYQMYEQQENQK